ncbi:unnamed protein product [Nesidiocoris tenuis]|uniref:BZIP domain-containing protein n=1 Tax=Nesidiocoris tenuis TaxID=355587 RepID=A0A6H5GFN1_9HEMI|nr:unnamed protein product [Nesidiocoris tenuis]
MIKEGLSLPTRYPLTKQEERDLKRIRRKIRNKISAQDSRKRKKEYVDGLEDRVKKCTAENANLIKKMKALQNENQSLSAQLKRLQAVIARNGPQQTNPTTCLVVLVLSLALVLAPNMRSASRAATPSDLSIPETKASSPIVLFDTCPQLEGRGRSSNPRQSNHWRMAGRTSRSTERPISKTKKTKRAEFCQNWRKCCNLESPRRYAITTTLVTVFVAIVRRSASRRQMAATQAPLRDYYDRSQRFWRRTSDHDPLIRPDHPQEPHWACAAVAEQHRRN